MPGFRVGAIMDEVESKVPLTELNSRMQRFRARMDAACPGWEVAMILGRVNLFYFTGTIQDGLLLIWRSQEAVYWVRRSYERALAESSFPRIQPMTGYRDAAAAISTLPPAVYLETEIVPLAMYKRLHKYFPFKKVESMDLHLSAVRAVKSPYELALMERSGEMHRQALEEDVPGLLREGMSESELGSALYRLLVDKGHQGLARFAMFDTDAALGIVAFGENSLYPTFFDGPGGNLGMSPSVPWLGSRQRFLRPGDLIFIDVGCGVEGYHTDKTQTYMFGATLPEPALEAHRQCVAIQDEVARRLKPGAVPAQIYQEIMGGLTPDFLENFMGFGARKSKFLGHGIGLVVDEWPALADGFEEPLQENMVLAVEPKKGMPGLGMVGIENTFAVTPQGGRTLTGEHPGIILV